MIFIFIFIDSFSVNVWCGIIDKYLVGPYFFDETLTTNLYLTFLQNNFNDLLENVPLNTRQNLWFHQDDAHSHNHQIVTEHLNNQYGLRWIGTKGPMRWPARSPDLNPLDFFLWGYLIKTVFEKQPRNVKDLKNKIRIACEKVNPDMISVATTAGLLARFKACKIIDGSSFELV